MPAMTLTQIRAQVRSVVDIDATDISDTTLDNIIGQGFDTIVYSEKRWPFYEVRNTFNTVASQKDYTLANIGTNVSQGLRDIISLRTDDHVIQYIGSDSADWDNPLNIAAVGYPWEWSFWTDTVRFYATPDSIQTIYYRAIRNPTAFGLGSSASANPDLPDPFHAVLTTYAIGRAYMQQEDPTMGNQYQAQFEIELDNITRRFADTPAPQPMVANSRTSTRHLAGFGALRFSSAGGVIW